MANLIKKPLDPFSEVEDLMSRFSQLMPSFGMRNWPTWTRRTGEMEAWNPTADLSETAEGYEVHAELPGVKQDDVKLTYDDNVLTVTGERKGDQEEKQKKYHRVERTFGRFERSFSIPAAIDDGNIQAQFKDGVLKVVLPKTKATISQAKTIPVQGG